MKGLLKNKKEVSALKYQQWFEKSKLFHKQIKRLSQKDLE